MIVIIMGVSGCGKPANPPSPALPGEDRPAEETTVGEALSQKLGWEYQDADWWHPQANKDKMKSGTPLTDEDRLPWLCSLHQICVRWWRDGTSGVLSCSSLKKCYRQIIIHGSCGRTYTSRDCTSETKCSSCSFLVAGGDKQQTECQEDRIEQHAENKPTASTGSVPVNHSKHGSESTDFKHLDTSSSKCKCSSKTHKTLCLGSKTESPVSEEATAVLKNHLFVLLHGSAKTLSDRLSSRSGHFMPSALLHSQLATLELPDPDEQHIVCSIERSVKDIVCEVVYSIADSKRV